MKKINLMLGTILLLIFSGASMAERPAVLSPDTEVKNVNESEKYIGTKINAHSGFLIAPKDNSIYPQLEAAKSLVGTGKTDKSGQFYFFLVENSPGEDLGVVLDAIEIPKGMELGGKPITDDCYIKAQPHEYIFVIGNKADKYSKNGRYIGRFIEPVVNAWRVEFMTKKFVEIPTEGIHCEIDMDSVTD